jgi:hypothetical protein
LTVWLQVVTLGRFLLQLCKRILTLRPSSTEGGNAMTSRSTFTPSLCLRTICAAAAVVLVPVTSAQTQAQAQAIQAPAASKSVSSIGLPMQRVVIDPVTGKLRLPDHDEISQTEAPANRGAASASRSAAPAASSTAGLESHPAVKRMMATEPTARFGAVAKRMSPENMSFSVAQRAADGKLETTCVAGEDAATHAMHSHTATGAGNDR